MKLVWMVEEEKADLLINVFGWSKAGMSSEEREPLENLVIQSVVDSDATEPDACLRLEPHTVQENDKQQIQKSAVEDYSIQVWTGSQQDMAGCRMRLQVPNGDAKGLTKSKCVSIASSEGTCLCYRMCLEKESSSNLNHAFMSNKSTLNLEGDTQGPEGLLSCLAESGNPDVAPQTFQDASVSSSTPRLLSLVCFLLGLLGESCILPAHAPEWPIESEEMDFGSEDIFNCGGHSETELEGTQFMASHLNNATPYLQKRNIPCISGKEADINKTQDELVQAVSDEECWESFMGRGTNLCLFWIAMALSSLSLFCSLCLLYTGSAS